MSADQQTIFLGQKFQPIKPGKMNRKKIIGCAIKMNGNLYPQHRSTYLDSKTMNSKAMDLNITVYICKEKENFLLIILADLL